MSDKPSFFSELKRRNVYKVAVAYAVVSWLLVQAASIFFPAFDAPAWVMKAFIVVLALGFPAALIFSWAFEITPEGIKRESEIEREESITHHTGRKIVGITVIVAVLAAALMVFQFFRAKVATSPTTQTEEGRSAGTTAVSDKSIAVLPFENLSRDPDNAYFADGIQDEILTRLAKIAELKVISRTSTQKYKSAPDNLRDIGRQLGVAHILEGSVQKISNAVHVNVQLIRTATDEHLWAESYNRKLDDVFGVEGEVAGAIAEQLNAKLTGAEQKAVKEKPTQNAAAYEAYLRGLALEDKHVDDAGLRQAIANYAQAVKLDPGFGLAWARLAIQRSFFYFNGTDPAENSAATVKEAADRAFALEPESGEAWVAQAVYRYRVLRDFSGALQAFEEARKRLPNSALVLEYMSYVERRLGHWDAGESHIRTAVELDPLNLNLVLSMVSQFLAPLRRTDECAAILNRVLQIAPGNESAIAGKAFMFQATGKLDEARKELEKIKPNSEDPSVDFARTSQAIYERRFDDAIALVEHFIQPMLAKEPLDTAVKTSLVFLGYCQEWAGKPNEARASFTRAVAAIKPSPDSVVPVDATVLRSWLALAYAGLGEKEKALGEARQALSDYANDAASEPTAEFNLALIEARLGDLDSAIAALPHLLEIPGGATLGDLRFNPFWDPLRKDPRFQKLLAEQTK